MKDSLKKYKYIYLIGIGGIGMSALARYFNFHKKTVFGHDSNKSELCKELELEGISINYIDSIETISSQIQLNIDQSLIIYTPAISFDQNQMSYFMENNFFIMKRSEVLGLITNDCFTIAVAGTHGKTTTSSMIAHILTYSGQDCTAFLGGISSNYNSNLLVSSESNIMVVEADEFDRSFLSLNPDIAIITSIDNDHTDIYKNDQILLEAFFDFSQRIKKGGKLVLEQNIDRFIVNRDDISILKYATESNAGYQCGAINVRCVEERMIFDADYNGSKITDLELKMLGKYNISNAIASILVAKELGIKNSSILSSIKTFSGVKRRCEIILNTKDVLFIDDYAHHPAEIKQIIIAVKESFPDRKITVIFQPHLYSRTRDLIQDFADSLSICDELILLDIFGSREKNVHDIHANQLLDICEIEKKEMSDLSIIVDLVKTKDIDILLSLGAGDISTVVDSIKEVLK